MYENASSSEHSELGEGHETPLLLSEMEEAPGGDDADLSATKEDFFGEDFDATKLVSAAKIEEAEHTFVRFLSAMRGLVALVGMSSTFLGSLEGESMGQPTVYEQETVRLRNNTFFWTIFFGVQVYGMFADKKQHEKGALVCLGVYLVALVTAITIPVGADAHAEDISTAHVVQFMTRTMLSGIAIGTMHPVSLWVKTSALVCGEVLVLLVVPLRTGCSMSAVDASCVGPPLLIRYVLFPRFLGFGVGNVIVHLLQDLWQRVYWQLVDGTIVRDRELARLRAELRSKAALTAQLEDARRSALLEQAARSHQATHPASEPPPSPSPPPQPTTQTRDFGPIGPIVRKPPFGQAFGPAPQTPHGLPHAHVS